MSAEENAAAEPAEIGEALVAALGFEPTEGKKLGRRVGSSASIADELSEAENTTVDDANNAPPVDDAFSVISTDDPAVDISGADNGNGVSSSSNGSAGGGGAQAAPAKKAAKSNRQRNRSRRGRNSTQRNNQRNRSGAGAGTSAKAESKPSLDEIKSAARPTVSGSDGTEPTGNDGASGETGSNSLKAAATSAKVGTARTDAEVKGDGGAKRRDDGADDPVAKAKAETEAIRKRLADAKRKAGIDPDSDGSAQRSESTDAKSGSGSKSKDSDGSGGGGTETSGETKAGSSSPKSARSGQPQAQARELPKDDGTTTDKPNSDSAKADGAKADGAKTEKVRAEKVEADGAKPEKAKAGTANSGKAGVAGAATGAAVTGELAQVEAEIDNQPPPPSAADAIELADVAARQADETAPISPPAKGPQTMDAQVEAKARVTAKVDPSPIGSPATLEADTIAVPVAPPTAVPQAQPAVVKEASKTGFPELPFPNPFRRKRRVQARKVRRVVRHIDPWSVLTFSVLFHLCVFAALLLASVLVWNAAEAAGTIENIETFITDLGDYESFEIKGDVVFKSAVAIAGILTLASSVLLVLLTVVFNLISDLVGGIRLTVIEEETVRVRRRK